VGIWLYWRYGRPKAASDNDERANHKQLENQAVDGDDQHHEHDVHVHHHVGDDNTHDMHMHNEPPANECRHIHHKQTETHNNDGGMHHGGMNHGGMNHEGMHHSKSTPFYVSVLIGVTHCGAGCVLGDIVGEWIVYGTNVTINGRSLWPEMLIGIRTILRYILPVLFYRPYERRLGCQNVYSCC
jgi:hypothetical protein